MSASADLITGRVHTHTGRRTFAHSSGRRVTRPTVLLLHGSGPGATALANWRGLMTSEMAQSRAFLAPDILGFGQSPASDGVVVDHRARLEHLVDFVDSLGTGPYDVIGNSMGGALALWLAAHRPDLVRRLVLMGTVGIRFPITEALDRVWGYTPSLANMRTVLELLAYDRSLVTDDLVAMRYAASTDPVLHEQYAAAFAGPRQRHVDGMAMSESELRAITTPALLVHGAHDQVVPLEATSHRLVRLLPNADLVVLGRCGHWTQIERASAFRRNVGAFLDG